jgi:hypothetical protein
MICGGVFNMSINSICPISCSKIYCGQSRRYSYIDYLTNKSFIESVIHTGEKFGNYWLCCTVICDDFDAIKTIKSNNQEDIIKQYRIIKKQIKKIPRDRNSKIVMKYIKQFDFDIEIKNVFGNIEYCG